MDTPSNAGAPGRGYGMGPSGAPSVYCQSWPGRSPYPQCPGTGPQTPCGPAFQRSQQPAQNQPSSGAGDPGAGSCWRGLPDGKLCTDGMFFKNGRGETVILCGVNLAGTSKIPPFLPLPARGPPNFDSVCSSDCSGLDALPGWGVNVIRLLFVWEAYEPVMDGPSTAYLRMLQRIASRQHGSCMPALDADLEVREPIKGSATCVRLGCCRPSNGGSGGLLNSWYRSSTETTRRGNALLR